MAGIQDFAIFEDDFWGADTFSTAGQGSPWAIADTSAAGTPTYATVSPSTTGELAITMASTSEVENVCLSFGDVLSWNIANLQSFEFRAKVSGVTSGTTFSMGLASARNDTPGSITARAIFRCTSALALTIDTDDNVVDSGLIATGASMVASTYKKFLIDFTGGKSNVKFFVDGQRVAGSTTFSMANYTGGLQPFFQVQKTASTNVDAITLDYVRCELKR